MKWIALFSQTGSELTNIINTLGVNPDLVITNNKYNTSSNYMTHDQIVSFLERSEPCLITLHGYLRILPPSVCKKHNIYNGHPGDIVTYPELKGKDPQKKCIELKLPQTGCIIHRVTSEVDSGEIIERDIFYVPDDYTEEQLISSLKDIQLELWLDFLRSELSERCGKT